MKALADGYLNFDTKLNTKGMSDGLSKLGNLAKSACKAAVASIAAAGTALAGLASKAVSTGMEFEAQMSRVKSISGATKKEFIALTNQAKQLGADTAFSASEAAAGMENLASAGFNASQIMQAMPGLLDLAAVSGGDVAAASEVAASALNAFGLKASEAGHVANVFAKAAADTNAEALDMGEAMKYVAPVAKAMGLSIEETAAAIGIMSDAGIKGSQAGTALRGALSRLSKPTSEMSKTMSALGLNFFNAKGEMIPLKEQVAMLQGAFKGLSKEQRNSALVTLYGQESLSGMLALIETGPDKLDELTTSFINSDGAAQEMAETMQDNLKGSIDALGGSLETMGIQVYEGLEKPLKSTVAECTEAVGRLSNAFTKGGFNGLTEALGGELAKAAAKVAEYSPKLVDAGVSLVLSLLDGVKRNSGRIANAGVEAGKAIVSGIVEVTPQIAAAGLEIMAALAKSLVGTQPAREIKKLANTVRKSFAEISSAVKSSVGTVKNLLGNLITIAAKVINAGIKPLTSAVVLITKNSKLFAVALAMTVTAMKAMSVATAVTTKIKALTTVVTKSKTAWAEAKAMMILMTTAEDLAAVKTAVLTGSLTAQEVVVGVVTGKIKLATIAQAAWNAITAANPFVLAAAALATLGAGIAAYCLMSDDATSSTDKYFESVMQSLEGIDDFKETLDNTVPSLASYDSLLSESGKTISDLDNAIDTVETNITNILSKAMKDQKAIRDEDIENIKNYTQQLYDLEQEKLNLYRSQQTAELRKIELEKGEITQEAAAQHIANLKETLDQSNQIVEDAYTAELTLIENKNNAGYYKDKAAYKAALDGAKKSHDDRLAENRKFYDDGYTQIQEAAAKWTEADAEMWEAMANAQTNYNQNHSSAFDYMASDTDYSLSELQSSYEEYFKAIEDGAGESAKNLIGFAISAKDSGQQVSDSVKDSTNTILNAFENLPESMQESGKEVLLSLIGGYESEIPALENAAEMSADEILSTLREYLNIEDGVSGESEKIGKQTGDGVGSGLSDSKSTIKSSAESAGRTATNALSSSDLQTSAKSAGVKIGAAFAGGISGGIKANTQVIKNASAVATKAAENAAKAAAQIHSPSRLMRDKVGKPLAEGIGVGIETQADSVAKRAAAATGEIMSRMKAAVAAENAYTQGRAVVSNYNNSSTTNNYNSSTTNNQSLNFYQPIQTPSQVARAARKAQEVI